MEVTEQDLRENYESLETEQLLELKLRGTLTDTANGVLEQILAERSISSEERAKLAAEIQEQLSEDDALMSSLASRGERLAGQLIDSFLAVLVLVLSFLVGIAVPILFGAGFIVAIAYLLFCDGFGNGQSIGKRALNIAVIDRRTGKPCTFGQSFLRNLLLMFLGVIDWVCIFGRMRQRLGDMAAKTIVVRVRHREATAA
jgi:uncharacterized RDD family membrane protein YckC